MTPVAVVVPCHNYGQYVEEALRSLAAQTVTPNEVLVIDDGSTDNSPEVLDRTLADLGDQIPIRIERHSNRGVVRTLNDGVASTSAPYIMFVSADDRVRPDLIEALRDALDANPKAGYAYPRMALFGDETGVYLSYPFSAGRLIFDHNYIPGAAMVRREAYLASGGLRELKAHEDWDLWLGFLAAGWPGVFVPKILYDWRRHAAARNHQSRLTRLRLRLAIVTARPSLLFRYAHLAVPYSTMAVWRRIRSRVGPPPPYTRSSSCWIEAPPRSAVAKQP